MMSLIHQAAGYIGIALCIQATITVECNYITDSNLIRSILYMLHTNDTIMIVMAMLLILAC